VILTLFLVWLAGLCMGLLMTWLKVRKPMDPIGRAITLMFGVVFSIFWPVVVVYCVGMGCWCLARWPEEIEP
jgi:xanthosine utilization system XapX-like protein